MVACIMTCKTQNPRIVTPHALLPFPSILKIPGTVNKYHGKQKTDPLKMSDPNP